MKKKKFFRLTAKKKSSKKNSSGIVVPKASASLSLYYVWVKSRVSPEIHSNMLPKRVDSIGWLMFREG